MAVYASALRSSSPQAKLGALTTQANLERRALALASEVRSGPAPRPPAAPEPGRPATARPRSRSMIRA